jgi:hypothetical protein
MMVFNAVAFIIAVALFTVLFCNDLKDKEYQNQNDWVSDVDMETIHHVTPPSAYSTSDRKYNFGRYREPIKDMNLHELTTAQRIAQKKEFVWTGVTDGEWFIGSALLQFGYTSGVIVYAYNAKLNETITTHLETPIVSFLGAKFSAAEATTHSSAVSGCASWNFLGLNASKCFAESTSSFEVVLTGTSKKSGAHYRIKYSLAMNDEAMGLVFPVGPNRPSIVTKMGGVLSKASIEYANGSIVFLNQPLGLMDYTRGLLRRVTVWYWTAVAWRDGEHRYGLQLSAGTYDSNLLYSLESTLWVDGVATHIRSRIVYTPLDTTVATSKSAWTVRSEDNRIQLTFSPMDVVVGNFHYGILDGDLYHIIGTYAGQVDYTSASGEVVNTKLEFAMGTLEDHYAKW